MWNSHAIDGCADGLARVHPRAETHLAPDDFDRALRRMKSELSITELRRRLLDPALDARTVLDISDRIETLQADR